jgi:hypothetical protein
MNGPTVGATVDESQLLPKSDRSATGNNLELDTQLVDYERKCKYKCSLSECGEAEGRMY